MSNKTDPLVEKVARAIEEHFSSADKAYLEHHKCALDAVKAVAEWLDGEGRDIVAAQLRAAASEGEAT